MLKISNVSKIKRKIARTGESGQALILVLVLLTFISLLIPALLGFIGTSARTGIVYDRKTSELYAADAGIQDAVWQIKYSHTEDDAVKFPGYNRYNYDDPPPWGSYQITSVNDLSVDVTIQNMWIPYDIPQPTGSVEIAEAQSIAEDGKLVVTDTMVQTGLTGNNGEAISEYKIKIAYYPQSGWSLPVTSIGVWLPTGFNYFTDTDHKSSLENATLFPDAKNQAIPVLQDWAGNKAVMWTFNQTPSFESFVPTQTTLPLVLEITFYFQSPADNPSQKPDAVAWINTVGASGGAPAYSWDASFIVTKITSEAGATTIESYNTKASLQKLASAVNGDYWATGNTLMKDAVYDWGHIRDTWLNASDHSSSSTVPLESVTGAGDGIPADADVAAAYLYWTGWYDESSKYTVFSDSCSNLTNWNYGTGWSVYSSSYFQGNGSGSAASKVLTLKNPINMSSYSASKVTVSWDQDVETGSGSGTSTSLPASDTGDSTGTWTSTGVNGYSQVSDSNNSTYITQTALSGGSAYFGYTPSFSIPSSATGISVNVNYTAEVPDPITFRATGTVDYGTTGVITPGLPSGLANNDICILVASTIAGGSINITSNGSIGTWTPISGSPINVTGGEKLYVWWGRYSSGSTEPSLQAGSDHIVARITAYANVSTVANPVDVSATGTETTSDTSFSFATGLTTTADNEMCIVVCSTGYDGNSTSMFSTMANASLTSLAERMDNVRNSGGGGGFALDQGFKMTDGTVGTWTSTLSNASPKAYICFTLKPAVAVTSPANVHSGIKIGGTLYNSTDAGSTPTASFTSYSYTYTTNPAGGAWTASDVNSIQALGVNATQGISVSEVSITVAYTIPITDSDKLVYAISNDGGVTWSADMVSLKGYADTAEEQTFSYDLPYQYLTSQFKIRFTVVGFSGSGQYCTIDNIKIKAMVPDNTVTFKIDGQQVYLDAYGVPQTGVQKLIADRNQVILNSDDYGNPMGFSYSCYKDVTTLVKAFAEKAPDPAVNVPGAGTYTLGDVYATLGINGNDSNGDQLAHAGWSLIIIYEGSTTLGHQLYLYDNFTYAVDKSDLVFDGDKTKDGSTIGGFIVPEQIAGETEAAKLTAFVGEGDNWLTGDFIAFNAPKTYWQNYTPPGNQSNAKNIPNSYKLWDGMGSANSNTSGQPNNVWNSLSLGTSADGIDLDTFSIPWGVLSPGDTSAHIDLYTESDNWNLVYIIVSFRSSVTTGNSLMYLIKTN